MNLLYFDCFSGISGDMTVGALIDAGGDPEYLAEQLTKLNMSDEYKLSWDKLNKNGIMSTKFNVILENKHDDHLHAKHYANENGHQSNHNDHVAHRSYQEIVKLIKQAGFSENVENLAIRIFTKLGKAEGIIHGVPLEDVHFHEVGAVDSIIDIVSVAILLDALDIEKIISSPIPVGSGRIHIDHGIYPVPAPATLEILRNVPVVMSDLKGELTTPTGAAIVSELASEYSSLPSMVIKSIGYGAGTKTFPHHPNVLRLVLGSS